MVECLRSVENQTYRPLEIIVVDDGSTDDTLRLVRSFSSAVRVLRADEWGPSASRNVGIRAAYGDFLAFLDQDDLWHQEKLARQYALFQSEPSLDVCVAHVQMFWTQELDDEKAQFRDHPRAGPIPGYGPTAMLARRRAFIKTGPFDEGLRFGDGPEWFIRAQERGLRIELLPDVLVYHRMHRNNLSRRCKVASREEFLRIVKASLDRRREHAGGEPEEYPFETRPTPPPIPPGD